MRDSLRYKLENNNCGGKKRMKKNMDLFLLQNEE
jgi:hypothetical protein